MGVRFPPGDAPIVPLMPEIDFISDMIENYKSFTKVRQHSFTTTFFLIVLLLLSESFCICFLSNYDFDLALGNLIADKINGKGFDQFSLKIKISIFITSQN